MKFRATSGQKSKTPASLLLFGLAFALLLILGAQGTAANGSGDQDPLDKELEPQAYLPLAVSYLAREWTQVGPKPADIEKFYSVAVCGNHILAGSDLGVHSRRFSSAANTAWVREQPTISAAPTVVIFHPDDCTIAYSASRGYGVYRGEFTNQGQGGWTWTRVDKDNQLTAARFVAILPSVGNSDSQVIYVAGDFGIRWLPEPPTTPQTWQSTNVNSQTTSIIADDPSFAVASVWNDGVYIRTSNAGWSPLDTSQPQDKQIYQVVVSGDMGLAGAQTGAFFKRDGNWTPIDEIGQTAFSVAWGELGWLAGLRKDGVYISMDDGLKWLPLNQGLNGVGAEDFQVRDLLGCPPAHGLCIFAATTTGIWRWGSYTAEPQGGQEP